MNKKECKGVNTNAPKNGLNAYSLAGIGIGSIIGGGFFLGTSLAINQAGPSIMLAFLFGGIIMSQVLGALTSISINRPVKGSFRVHTEQLLGKYAGFLIGWSIFVSGILTLGSEAIATAVFLRYWLPHFSPATLAISTLLLVIVINGLGTKGFSFIESSMSFIKIALLLFFIILGAFFLINNGIVIKPNPFHNLQTFFPNGLSGLFQSMLIVVFTYNGINTVAMATSDVRKPCYEIPKACIILTFGLIFIYVVSMFVVVTTVDWSSINTNISPFVQGFDRMGYGWASTLVNAVIIVATVSVMLGSFYGCVQMLVSLSEAKEAPKFLAITNKRGIYRHSLLITGAIAIGIVLLSFILGTKLFNYLLSSASYFVFMNWIINLVTYLVWLRKRGPNEIYDAPFIKGSIGAIIAGIVILILLGFSLVVRDFRIGFYVALCITLLITAAYKLFGINK